jgi:hypothetical protein
LFYFFFIFDLLFFFFNKKTFPKSETNNNNNSKTYESIKKLGKGVSNNVINILGSIDNNTNQIVDEIGKMGVNTTKKLFGSDVSEVSSHIFYSSKNVFDGVKKVKGFNSHKLLQDSFVVSAKEASKEFAKKISKEKEEENNNKDKSDEGDQKKEKK